MDLNRHKDEVDVFIIVIKCFKCIETTWADELISVPTTLESRGWISDKMW